MGVNEGKDVTGGSFSIIALVLVIALAMGFIIFAITQFTKAQNRISQTTGSLDAAQFSAYDNKVITGDQVMSAVRTYINQDIVLIVDNKNTDISFYTTGEGDTLAVDIGTGESFFEKTVPYNIGITARAATPGATPEASQLCYSKEDSHIYTGKAPSGNENIVMEMSRNTNIRPLVTKVINGKPSAMYVEAGASYYSVLLYEPSTKTVNGIAFCRNTDR